MNTRNATLGIVTAALAASLIAPLSASAQDNRQKTKNNWRNAAAGAAAVAGYGLLKHNSAATVLGAAGAAYSANRYEQDRKHQSQASHEREQARARYRRHGGNYVRDGKKYYKYDGQMYVMDLNSGARHPLL